MPGRHSTAQWPAAVAIWVGVSAFALMAAWSLAAPVYSGPDEPAQVIRAVSVAHGEIVGQPFRGPKNANTRVVVPQAYAIGHHLVNCYKFHPEVPASCATPVSISSKPVRTVTYAGRYPPLYYLLVGWPSLIVTSSLGVHLIRLVGALLGALMLGLAVYAVRRWSTARTLPLGVLVAATPMALYLGGVVNPNGLEITAAICLWTSGLVLFTENRHDPPPGLLAIVTLSAAVLTSMRGLSPLWTVLILAIVISLGSWRDTWRLLRTRRGVQISAAVLLAVGVAAVAWILGDHALDLIHAGLQISPGTSNGQVLSLSVRSAPSWIPQMVGIFGSLDTPAPSWALDVWYGCALAVFALGMLGATARRRAALIGIVLVGFVLSVLVQYGQARRVGLVWEGRYLLPFAVGLVLVSTATSDRPSWGCPLWRALTPILAIGVFAADAGSLFQLLRRYTVGATGPLDLRGPWRPPGGPWLLLAMAAVASAAFAGGMVAASRGPREAPLTTLGPSLDLGE
ncbi:MAG: DUF2142 domain-containing protein [Acidimicrobiales bacterium]